jgi:DNA-binding MarR family transcriptional regulator
MDLATQISTNPINEFDDQIFRALFRTTGVIRQIMIPLFEEHGISVAQWVILRILDEREQTTPEAMRMVELSQHLCIRQPSLTPLINKLVMQHLVRRAPSYGEKRGRRISLTPQGRSFVKELLIPHGQFVSGLLNAFDHVQKQQFLELIETLKGRVELAARIGSDRHAARLNSKARGNF